MAAKKVVTTTTKEAGSLFEEVDGREVTYVRLHQATAAHGVFGMEKTLTKAKVPGIQMKFDGRVLYWKKGEKEGFIPAAAISDGVFA